MLVKSWSLPEFVEEFWRIHFAHVSFANTKDKFSCRVKAYSSLWHSMVRLICVYRPGFVFRAMHGEKKWTFTDKNCTFG